MCFIAYVEDASCIVFNVKFNTIKLTRCKLTRCIMYSIGNGCCMCCIAYVEDASCIVLNRVRLTRYVLFTTESTCVE